MNDSNEYLSKDECEKMFRNIEERMRVRAVYNKRKDGVLEALPIIEFEQFINGVIVIVSTGE